MIAGRCFDNTTLGSELFIIGEWLNSVLAAYHNAPRLGALVIGLFIKIRP